MKTKEDFEQGKGEGEVFKRVCTALKVNASSKNQIYTSITCCGP